MVNIFYKNKNWSKFDKIIEKIVYRINLSYKNDEKLEKQMW